MLSQEKQISNKPTTQKISVQKYIQYYPSEKELCMFFFIVICNIFEIIFFKTVT